MGTKNKAHHLAPATGDSAGTKYPIANVPVQLCPICRYPFQHIDIEYISSSDEQSEAYSAALDKYNDAVAALNAAKAKSDSLAEVAQKLANSQDAEGHDVIIIDDAVLSQGADVQYSYTADGNTYTRTVHVNVDEGSSYRLESSTKGSLYQATGDDVYKITGSASNGDETVSINGALLKGSKIDLAAGENTLEVGGASVAVGATGSTILSGKNASSISLTGDTGISATKVTMGADSDTLNITSTNSDMVVTEPLSPYPSSGTYQGTSYAVSGGTINVGNGDNSVVINTQTGIGMTGNAKLIAGTGNDSIEVAALARYGWAVYGGSIAAGEGNNTITLGGLVGLGRSTNASGRVTAKASLTTGKGNDSISIRTSGGDGLTSQMGVGMYYSSIKDTGGANTVTINYDGGSGAVSMHNSTISLGAGNDEVTMSSVYSGNLYGFIQTTLYGKSILDTGAGDDKVTLKGNVTGTNKKNMSAVNLGAGQNILNVEGNLAYATIAGGAGKDIVSIIGENGGTYGVDGTATLQPAQISYATINLGAGDNELAIGDVAGEQNGAGSEITYSSVTLGAGNDTAQIIGHLDSSTIKDAGGNNAITLSSTTAEGIILTNSSVTLGSGHDTLQILASGTDGKAIFGSSGVSTGAGDDLVEIAGDVHSQVAKAVNINLGAGNNTLTIDGDVGFMTYLVDRDNYTWASPTTNNYVTITGGAQSDDIAVTGTISGATVNAGAGNDSVTIGKTLGDKAILAGGKGKDTLNVAGIATEVMTDQYLLDTSSTTLVGSSGKISGFEVLDVGSNDGLSTLLTITGNLPTLLSVDTAVKYTVTTTDGTNKTYNEKSLIITGDEEDSYRLGADWTVLGVTTVGGVEYTVLQHSDGKARVLVDNAMAIRETTSYTTNGDIADNANLVDVAISLTEAFEKTFGSLEWSTLDLGDDNDSVTVTGRTGVAIINTGAGADSLNLSGATESSTVSMGAGNNSLTVASASASSFDLGDGADTVRIAAASDSIFDLGGGADTLTVADAASSTFNLGAGNDGTTLGGGTDLTINMGTGQDTLAINGPVSGVTVTTQSGDNSLSIAGWAYTELTAQAGEVYETTGPTGYPYTSHTITVTPTEYMPTNGVAKSVSATLGSGNDTLRIGDNATAAMLAGGYFDVGDGENVVDVHLRKAYYAKNNNYHSQTSNGGSTNTYTDTTYEAPVIALAGNLGEATISIVEDPALVAARQSYLHLQIGSALSDGMTKLGASTIDMGAGVNTLSIYGATQLSDTTFKFADTSTNLINVGGDSISMADTGIYLDDVTFDLGASATQGTVFTNRFDAWGMQGMDNKLTVLGIGAGNITLADRLEGVTEEDDVPLGNDTLTLALGKVADLRGLGINLGSGDDSLTITTNVVEKIANLTINAGDGEDSIYIDTRTTSAIVRISDATAGHTTVLLGNDSDTLNLTATSGTFINTVYDLGEGDNSLSLSNKTGKALDNVTLKVGSGTNKVSVGSGYTDDVLTIDGNITGGGSTISLAAGNDSLTLKNGTYSSSLTINMGDGADTLTLAGNNAITTTSTGKAAVLTGGAGTDVLQAAGLLADVGDSERMLALGKDYTFAKTTGFEILDIGQLEGTDKSVLLISGESAINLGAEVRLTYTVTFENGDKTDPYTEAVLRITGNEGDMFKLSDGWSVVGTTTVSGVAYSVVQREVTAADDTKTTTRILVDNKLNYMPDTAISSADGVTAGAGFSHVAITLEEALNRSITSLGWSSMVLDDDSDNILTITGTLKTSSLASGAGKDSINVQAMAESTVSLGHGQNSVTANTVSNTAITIGKDADVLSLGAVDGSTVVMGDGNNVFEAASLTSSTVTAGADDDAVTLGSMTDSSLSLGQGNNTLTVSDTTTSAKLSGGAYNDSVTLHDIAVSTVNMGAGTNELKVTGEVTGGNIVGGTGNDNMIFEGNVGDSTLALNAGDNNTLSVEGTISNTKVTAIGGANTLTLADVTTSSFSLTGGDNTLTVSGLMEGGSIAMASGNDSISLQQAKGVSIDISDGGNDTLCIAQMQGSTTIAMKDGVVNVGEAQLNLTGSSGADTLTMTGRFSSSAASTVSMQGGNDVLVLSGTSITSRFGANMGEGDDTIKLTGELAGLNALHVDGGAGSDVIMAEGLLNQLTTGTAVNNWGLTLDSGLLPTTVTGFEVLNIASADGGSVLLTIAGDAPATLGGTAVNYSVGGADYTEAALVLTGAAGDSFKLGEGWSVLGETTVDGKGYTVVQKGSARLLIDSVLTQTTSDTSTADSVIVSGADLTHTHVTLTQAVTAAAKLSSLSWTTLDLAAADNTLHVSGAVKASTVTGGGNDSINLLGAVSGSDISLGNGNSTLTTGAMFGHTAVEAGGGADVLSLGTVTSSTVNLGDGANTLTTGDVAYGTLLAGAGSNTITLGTAASNSAVGMRDSSLVAGDGGNNVTVKGLTSYSTMQFGSGNDTVSLVANLAAHRHDYNVIDLGEGDNSLSVTGTYRYGSINIGDGKNTVNGVSLFSSKMILGDGGNIVNATTVQMSTVSLGLGQDVVTVSQLTGSAATRSAFDLGGGNDNFVVSTSAANSDIRMGAGDDTVSFGTSAKAVTSISNVAVDLGDGTNKLSVYAGTSTAANNLTVSGAVSIDSAMTFGTGADKLTFDNATLTSGMTVNLGAGADTLTLAGSTTGQGSFDGGAGIDVLNLDGMGATITFGDLFGTDELKLMSFESIDLTGDTANILTLTLDDVKALNSETLAEKLTYSAGADEHEIAKDSFVSYLTGNANDSINLADSWSDMGSLTIGDISYKGYQGTGADANRYLLVQSDVNVA